MKILLVSNAPWVKSGYGTQAASLARRLRDDGHKVVFYATFGLQGGVQQWEGITVMPDNGQGFVDDIIRGHLLHTQPDLVITLFDLWPLYGTEIPQYIRDVKAKWLAWFPVDAIPMSAATISVLNDVDYPVALGNFVEDEVHRLNPEWKIEVIPHGIEKDWGWTAAGRREFRRLLQVPEDAFLFGSVGRNAYYPGRKGFDRLIRAFGEANLPNSYLYLHTHSGSENGAVPVPKVVDFFERMYPGISGRIKLADDYNIIMGYSQDGMNAMYSAIDCYVQPTLGEGFGIPVMEAQACGCAVIATDCTSMPEIVAPNSSELIPGATDLFVPDPSLRVLIDIPKLAEAMTRIYEIKRDDPNGFLAMKGTAGQWANGWDWDALWMNQWKPLLAKIEAEIALSPPRDWHRGGAMVFEHEGRMRKQESFLKSPVLAKVLALRDRLGDIPGLVPILDRGVTEDGLHWYDMPKLTPLREIDLAGFTNDGIEVFLGDVRRTLEALHAVGVAHRDVCPENIVVDEVLRPYLIDFEWAGPCEGTIGQDCVDFEPWHCMDRAVPIMQRGMESRGFHTIVNYLKGLPLDGKTHGYKGVPYQQVDGVGERDCQVRWDIMKPDVAGKRVLDVGCNMGWFVRQALKDGAVAAVGIDNDEAVVETAEKLAGGGAYSVMDVTMLNGQLGHFDVAFCLSVLQHVENPDRVLRAVLAISREVYVEIPTRFVTEYMAEILGTARYLGESERGRPMYHVTSREVLV